MEQTTTLWLSTATSVATPDVQQDKAVELASTFNQPAVLNFATIFAGASAAVSHATAGMTGQRVPSLSQIGISPSKRSTVIPLSSLQAIPSISQLTPISQAQLPSASTIVVDSLNGITPLTTTIYTLPLPSDPIQISKNFIQQAAAASGLATSSASLSSTVTNEILISPPETIALSPKDRRSGISELGHQVQSPVASTFQCTECGKTFKSGGQLSYHTFVSHAQLQARPHKCSACPESFLVDHHLKDHMRAIHLSPEQGGGPPFVCSECMASFDDGGHLNFHLYMAHTIQGSKPAQEQFPCPECGKNFIKSSIRAAHIRNVHSGQVYAVVTPDHVQVQSTFIDVKSHKCIECGKGFKTQSYLKQHTMSVHEKPLKCSVCSKGFGRKSDLKRHMRGVHMKKRPHQCSKCGWTFSEMGNLKHHLQAVHQKEKNYRCMYCDKTFSMLSYLRTHLTRMHHINLDNLKTASSEQDESMQLTITPETVTSQPQDSTIGEATPTSNALALPAFQISIAQAHVARCYECGQTFQNTQLLQNHVMSTHPRPFWCTVCGEGFANAAQLQLHLQLRHVSMGHQNPSGTIAAVQSTGQIALEIHEPNEAQVNEPQALPMTPHSTCVALPAPPQPLAITTNRQQQQSSQANVVSPRQPFPVIAASVDNHKCKLCGIECECSPEVHVCWRKIHMPEQTEITDVVREDRPHLCNECGKGFKTTTHLKQHLRCVHSKERPHKCTQCDKCFARTSDLNRHIKGVHERLKSVRNAAFVTLKCSECGAIYAETSQLKRHIYTHHLRGRPSYKCADCQEGFSDETAFQNHICHEEEKPHVCSFCSKRFQMVPQLRRHVRAAHGRNSGEPQVHKCFQCERIFGRPIDLERHIQAVHLKEKPHKCTLCGKTFGLQGNLNKHVRAVHLLEKPHQCIECGKRFAHVGVLKRHLRDIHFYDKKASVKQKLAQIQMENARALICNTANLRSDTNSQDANRQLQGAEPRQHSTQKGPPEAIEHRNDLPTIENLASVTYQERSPHQPAN